MDIYNIKWSIILALSIISYAIYLCKKYHWSAGILFGYVGLNTLSVFSYPQNIYSQLPNNVFHTLTGYTAKSFIALLLMVILVDMIKKDVVPKLLLFILSLDAILTIYQFFTVDKYHLVTGFLDNISLNGGLLAVFVPVILSIKNIPMLLLFITAILCCKASVASGTLALALASYYFMKHKSYLIPVLLFCAVLGTATLVDKSTFSGSGRFMLYKIQLKSFLDDKVCYPEKQKQVCLEDGNNFTGRSTGTFHFWAFITQVKYYLTEGKGKTGEIMRFLHSDWLQIMMEFGYIGLALSILLAGYLIFMSWGEPMMFSMLISYMGFMVFHYPIHYPLQAFVGLWIIAHIILSYKENNSIITLREIK